MGAIKTVYDKISNEIIIKKSRFISHIMPIDSEEEALHFISQIKSLHWDATHNVFAYILDNNNIERYTDDGEPKGTAGIPTIQTIKDMGISNVAVVTTRYFGGIMLGTGGLIRAYRKSVSDGLKNARIVINEEQIEVQISIDYTYLSKVQSMAQFEGFIISNIVYEDVVLVNFIITQNQSFKLSLNLTNILSKEVRMKALGNVIVTVDEGGKLVQYNQQY